MISHSSDTSSSALVVIAPLWLSPPNLPPFKSSAPFATSSTFLPNNFATYFPNLVFDRAGNPSNNAPPISPSPSIPAAA